jgi:hypothetical protein
MNRRGRKVWWLVNGWGYKGRYWARNANAAVCQFRREFDLAGATSDLAGGWRGDILVRPERTKIPTLKQIGEIGRRFHERMMETIGRALSVPFNLLHGGDASYSSARADAATFGRGLLLLLLLIVSGAASPPDLVPDLPPDLPAEAATKSLPGPPAEASDLLIEWTLPIPTDRPAASSNAKPAPQATPTPAANDEGWTVDRRPQWYWYEGRWWWWDGYAYSLPQAQASGGCASGRCGVR